MQILLTTENVTVLPMCIGIAYSIGLNISIHRIIPKSLWTDLKLHLV